MRALFDTVDAWPWWSDLVLLGVVLLVAFVVLDQIAGRR